MAARTPMLETGTAQNPRAPMEELDCEELTECSEESSCSSEFSQADSEADSELEALYESFTFEDEALEFAQTRTVAADSARKRD